MIPPWQIATGLLASYLIGGIPFGLIVARLKGVDIRRRGSGNLGATNVGRTLGRKWGVLVLTLDAAKGAITSLGAARLIFPHAGVDTPHTTLHSWIWLGTGVCCVLGNIAPIYLRFKGGKGVATTLGVILGIFPYLTIPALFAALIWAMVVKTTRYVSLASICAALSLPIGFGICVPLFHWPLATHYPLLGLTLVVAVMVLIRHRSNMGRLRAGIENKIGEAQP
ncbi:MAG: glycerol-3-phosphate 1-O-acyltransferase PlsY [Phycisphaerae bacterium]